MSVINFASLRRRLQNLGVDTQVTHYTLTLGAPDGTTGHFDRNYASATINMVILVQAGTQLLTAAGVNDQVRALGFTDTSVSEGDKIVDSNGTEYVIVTVQKMDIGDRNVYYGCGLAPAVVSALGSATVTEGDYISWAIYDSFDDADTVNSVGTDYQFVIFNRIESVALLVGTSDNTLKTYTISTKALSAAHGVSDVSAFYGTYSKQSAYGTYVVILDGNDEIHIFKNGVLLQTSNAAALGFNANKVCSVHISPTGKYIAVSGQRTATTTDGWVILVGT